MSNLGKILIVDDEETFLLATSDLLRREGFEVDCAHDAPSAREKLLAQQYDLLISDVKMPGNADLELIRDIPQLAQGLPVILVTGYPSLHSAMQSFHLPVITYLAKPVDFEELLEHARGAIERSRTYRSVVSAQQRLQDWREQLQSVAQVMQETPRELSLQPTLTFLSLTMQNLVGCLSDLKNISEALAQQSAAGEPCHLLNCPRPTILMNAILETIAVLEKTKNSFKSKELGDLRKKLIMLVETTLKEKIAPPKP